MALLSAAMPLRAACSGIVNTRLTHTPPHIPPPLQIFLPSRSLLMPFQRLAYRRGAGLVLGKARRSLREPRGGGLATEAAIEPGAHIPIPICAIHWE